MSARPGGVKLHLELSWIYGSAALTLLGFLHSLLNGLEASLNFSSNYLNDLLHPLIILVPTFRPDSYLIQEEAICLLDLHSIPLIRAVVFIVASYILIKFAAGMMLYLKNYTTKPILTLNKPVQNPLLLTIVHHFIAFMARVSEEMNEPLPPDPSNADIFLTAFDDFSQKEGKTSESETSSFSYFDSYSQSFLQQGRSEKSFTGEGLMKLLQVFIGLWVTPLTLAHVLITRVYCAHLSALSYSWKLVRGLNPTESLTRFNHPSTSKEEKVGRAKETKGKGLANETIRKDYCNNSCNSSKRPSHNNNVMMQVYKENDGEDTLQKTSMVKENSNCSLLLKTGSLDCNCATFPSGLSSLHSPDRMAGAGLKGHKEHQIQNEARNPKIPWILFANGSALSRSNSAYNLNQFGSKPKTYEYNENLSCLYDNRNSVSLPSFENVGASIAFSPISLTADNLPTVNGQLQTAERIVPLKRIEEVLGLAPLSQSNEQDVIIAEKLLVGVLLFVPLLILLPTTFAWYLIISALSLVTYIIRILISYKSIRLFWSAFRILVYKLGGAFRVGFSSMFKRFARMLSGCKIKCKNDGEKEILNLMAELKRSAALESDKVTFLGIDRRGQAHLLQLLSFEVIGQRVISFLKGN
mmetsp:Transcript_33040/g.59763  ORF Transcript_33040/g.59763 Transcript_33040/m.59763 type:complete len:638 (-) Transcript_33040:1286-3199(-)